MLSRVQWRACAGAQLIGGRNEQCYEAEVGSSTMGTDGLVYSFSLGSRPEIEWHWREQAPGDRSRPLLSVVPDVQKLWTGGEISHCQEKGGDEQISPKRRPLTCRMSDGAQTLLPPDWDTMQRRCSPAQKTKVPRFFPHLGKLMAAVDV